VARADIIFQERFNKIPAIQFPTITQEKQHHEFYTLCQSGAIDFKFCA
jgi:hypothetical protein